MTRIAMYRLTNGSVYNKSVERSPHGQAMFHHKQERRCACVCGFESEEDRHGREGEGGEK